MTGDLFKGLYYSNLNPKSYFVYACILLHTVIIFLYLLHRFLNMKFKSVTFINSTFENCFFKHVTSVGSFFRNCTFIDAVFYNTGKIVISF